MGAQIFTRRNFTKRSSWQESAAYLYERTDSFGFEDEQRTYRSGLAKREEVSSGASSDAKVRGEVSREA
jgi:hypothetical protein